MSDKQLPKRKPAELLLAMCRTDGLLRVLKGMAFTAALFSAICWIFNINVLLGFQIIGAWYAIAAISVWCKPANSTKAVSTNDIELLSAVAPQTLLTALATFNDKRRATGGVQYGDLYLLHNEMFMQEKNRLLKIKKD